MPISEAFVKSFQWAHHCLKWLQEQGKGEYLLQPDTTIPLSTWFSGYSCPEWAVRFISAARTKLTGSETPVCTPLYQYEWNARARHASLQYLPKTCCQHIDIRNLLSKDDRAKVEEIIQAGGDDVADKTWALLDTMTLKEESQTCSRHLMCCPFATSTADISGSQCVHYSSMGKKVDGALLGKNGAGNLLLQVYCKYHIQRRTPLLFHENVIHFDSTELEKRLSHGGYKRIAQIKTAGQDAGLNVNPRRRV